MKTPYHFFFIMLLALASFTLTTRGAARQVLPGAQADKARQEVPVSAASVPVAARKAGRVWEVYVKNGQHVQQGQTMFKIALQVTTAMHPGHQIDYDVAKQQYIKVLALNKANKASAEAVAAAKFQLHMASRLVNDSPQQVLFHYVDAPISGTLSNVSKINQLQASSVLATITPDPAPKPKMVAVAK